MVKQKKGIEIAVYCNRDGVVLGFRAEGHANTAPHGQDIVCAAVSVLTQTAALGLSEHLHKKVLVEQKSGVLVVKLAQQPDALTEAVFQTMLIGLREVEKINPRVVHIQWMQEVSKDGIEV